MITTTIATTFLDANKEKFTLNVLKKFRDHINTVHPQIKVKNKEIGEIIGHVSKANVSNKKLKVTLDIKTKEIDKRWEYFFVPHIKDGKFQAIEGMTTITSAKIVEVHMVKFPSDISLDKVVFPFVEGEDYFVVKPDEITDSQIKEFLLKQKPVAVYYHMEPMEEGLVTDDAVKRGFLVEEEGQIINQFPFFVQAVEDDFETVREWAANQFKTK